MDSGAPQAAADLLGRALAEPPPQRQRAAVLREAARAEVSAGRTGVRAAGGGAAAGQPTARERAEIALEVAEAYAALFRWVDAVDVIERALAELGEADEVLTARLEGELVVCGLHDARSAPQVTPVLARLGSRRLGGSQRAARGRAGNGDAAGGPAGGPDRGPAGGGAGPRRRRGLRTGTRGRRCCGCWSSPSASPPSRSRSSRCWPRFTAPVRRAASWPPTAPSACSSCGSARCPRPTRPRGSRCACCRRETSRRARVRGDRARRRRRRGRRA